MGKSARVSYFLGTMSFIGLIWYGATVIGAVFGSQIPPEYALDFAVPITFLALIGPMLKTTAHMAAAFTSIVLALVLAFIPYNLGLIIAAVCAMMVGAQIELMQQRWQK